MADYRQFCNTCSAEVGFGGHEPGCPVPAQARAEEAERKWKELQKKKQEQAEFVSMDDKELINVAVEVRLLADQKYSEYEPYEKRAEVVLDVLRDRGLQFEFIDALHERRRKESD